MKKFLQNFQISKIDDFHSKSLNFAENHRSEVLSHRAPEDTIRKDFVHSFKFLNRRAPQKYLHTPGTPYVSAKNSISTFFPLSQHIAKLLRKYCIKTFSIILILFFSKTPEKVGFLKKKYVWIRRTQHYVVVFPTGPVGNKFLKKKRIL